MADPLGAIDEDAPPEPVIPLDPELEVGALLRPVILQKLITSRSYILLPGIMVFASV